jgi:hypothetical protein
MIFFEESTRSLISNLGWVDGPSIWLFDVDKRRSRLIPVSSAKYMSLLRFGDVLRIVRGGGVIPTLSLRRLSNLDEEAARVELDSGTPKFSGDDALWGRVDVCTIVPWKMKATLLCLDAKTKSVEEVDLSWLYEGDFDLAYQTVTDCLSLPDGEHAVVSVLRSSQLALLNIRENRKVADIQLASRFGGNPQLMLREDASLIVSNYDTLCRIDLNEMVTTAAALLQGHSTDFVA